MTNEELVVKIQNGEEEYLQTLFEQNGGLIHTIAEKYRYLKEDREDLESICRIEMWKAIATYDSTKNTLFASYATTFMMRGLNRFIVREKSAKRTGNVVSLNKKYDDGSDNNYSTLQDRMIDYGAFEEYEEAEKRVLISQIMNLLDELDVTEREKEIFCSRHIHGLGLRAIGEKIGTSHQNVDQICKRIFLKVKNKIDEIKENISA